MTRKFHADLRCSPPVTTPTRRVRPTELREICYQVGHAWERYTPLLMRCILCYAKWKRPELRLLP